MKRQSSLIINTDGDLKVRRHTIVHTRSFEEEVLIKDIIHTFYHIIVEDGLDSRLVEDEVEDAPSELEDGG